MLGSFSLPMLFSAGLAQVPCLVQEVTSSLCRPLLLVVLGTGPTRWGAGLSMPLEQVLSAPEASAPCPCGLGAFELHPYFGMGVLLADMEGPWGFPAMPLT